MKGFPSGVAGGLLFSEGHRTVSPPKMLSFGGPNMSGDASISKQASKIPLGDKPDSPESSINVGATPTGLRVG